MQSVVPAPRLGCDVEARKIQDATVSTRRMHMGLPEVITLISDS